MKLPRWLGKLLYGGTSSLHAGEASLLAAVSAALNSDERRILEDQIAAIWLVQRPQPARMSIISYHDRDKVPSFDDCSYERCLAEVSLAADGRRRSRVKLMLHRGYFHSFEGRIPEGATSSADCSIVLWPQRNSKVASAIDRLEHRIEEAQQAVDGNPH